MRLVEMLCLAIYEQELKSRTIACSFLELILAWCALVYVFLSFVPLLLSMSVYFLHKKSYIGLAGFIYAFEMMVIWMLHCPLFQKQSTVSSF